METSEKNTVSGYSKYNKEAKRRKKINPLEKVYPSLPSDKYDVTAEKCSTTSPASNP